MNRKMGDGTGGQRPIQGYRQYEKTQKDLEEPIDKDEFQKKIKEVESSTEAPHKKKREQAEEGAGIEGLAKPDALVQTNADVEPSPFEVQSPQASKGATYSGQKGADLEFLETPAQPPEEDDVEEPTPFAPPPEEEPVAAPTLQQPTRAEKPEPQQQSTEQTTDPTEEKKEKTPTKATPTPITEKKLTEKPEKEITAPLPQTPEKKKPAEAKKPLPKTASTKEEEPVTQVAASEIAKVQKEKAKKTQEEKGVEGVAPTDQPVGAPAIAAPGEVAGTNPLNLPPEIFELFDRMVSYITIEHSKSGVQTTTVEISMKNSLFDGAKLKLERFPTARDTFNVQLSSTNPKAVDLFNANAQSLAAAFQYGRYAFKVNVNRAVHTTEDTKSKVRRVERKEDESM